VLIELFNVSLFGDYCYCAHDRRDKSSENTVVYRTIYCVLLVLFLFAFMKQMDIQSYPLLFVSEEMLFCNM